MNTIGNNKNFPEITLSDKYYERALSLIPSQTQTLAKGPSQHVNGVAPKYLLKGKGSHVWDVDGNEYIDFNMAIGPLSLGYAFPETDEAIRKQLEDGITFSLMHPLEVEVAELLHEIIPNAESIRYSKGGADVTSAAVRLARAFTGKNKVICCGYHGWHDWYIGTTARNSGIPEAVRGLTTVVKYNDIASFEAAIDENTACVILEPVVFEKPKDNFLHQLRDLCSRKGVLLIFDEMWTGFRIALGGAQEYFGIKADLACFSKAVANGMPISVLTGRADVMGLLDTDVFFYTTFGGEALSLAAAKATIEFMKKNAVQEKIARTGKKLREGLNALLKEYDMPYIDCVGYDYRTLVTIAESAGDPLIIKSLLQQELIKRGILWSGFHTISYSHSDADIEAAIEAYREALPIVKQAVSENTVAAQLLGKPVEPVFRKTKF